MDSRSRFGCLLLVGMFIAWIQCSKDSEQRGSNSGAGLPAGAIRTARNPLPTIPVQPLPPTGVLSWGSTKAKVAPLAIATKGSSHYYVKLIEASTGALVGTFFIRSGRRLDVEVPLGTFELRYAAGETWYGEPALFGPDTAYSRADDTFRFKQTLEGYSGYTVELYLQPNGNLRTERMSAEDF